MANPVSYTHLDVYKRQRYSSVFDFGHNMVSLVDFGHTVASVVDFVQTVASFVDLDTPWLLSRNMPTLWHFSWILIML